ncbi:hypothetical protein SRABI70_04829 [Pseudomonas sp. Bi70]|nr:hypothetical protein SRABI70_04829 [Pseudomonas sp. Bi70]
MALRLHLAIAFGQVQGTLFDTGGQVAASYLGTAVGLAVFEQAGMFFAQAHGFAEPEALQLG